MEILVANVDHIEFKIERDLNEQFGALPLPFPGMDKSTAAVCQFFNRCDSGQECEQGVSCPFRHIRGDRTIVCKHWLRGLCKKGDQCEFLHEYDMTKMPECYFYSRFNACHNKECPFLHIDPESKIRDCPWYDRGFCRHGPHCRHRHVRRVLCTNYLAGLCVDGAACKFMHPRFELPPPPEVPKDQMAKRPPTCHYCGELGHKASYCQNMPPEQREASIRQEEAKFRSLGYMRPVNHHYQHHHREREAQQAAEAAAAKAAAGGGGGEEGAAAAAVGGEAGAAAAAATATGGAQEQQTGEGAAAGGAPAGGGGGGYVGRGGGYIGGGRGRRPDRGPPRPLEEITCFKCGGKGHYANRCPKGHLAFLSNNHQYNQQPPSQQQQQQQQQSQQGEQQQQQ